MSPLFSVQEMPIYNVSFKKILQDAISPTYILIIQLAECSH